MSQPLCDHCGQPIDGQPDEGDWPITVLLCGNCLWAADDEQQGADS